MAEFNYFNYFTEIEEHFWRKRGAHLLVSPLDWAIVETWQKSGIPLSAVLKGIDRAFESYARSRRGAAGRAMKSLAYCVDAVLESAAQEKEAHAGAAPAIARAEAEPSFAPPELRTYFTGNAARLREAAAAEAARKPVFSAQLERAARSLHEMLPILDSPGKIDLEDLERRLTALEDKLIAAMTTAAGDDALLSIRRDMDRALSAYRRKMTAEQLSLVERQFQQKRLFEYFRVPRLSLFYLVK